MTSEKKVNCPYAGQCRFAQEKLQGGSLSVWIEMQFCRKQGRGCARSMVADILGADKVPDDLYPTRADKGLQILSLTHELESHFA